MDPNDRVDLTSVNKTKKQLKLPTLKNPFKKQTGPNRDNLGQFTSGGSGGLINTKHFNWGRALPLVLIIALAGGYMVYRSFAGTFRACSDTSSGSYAAACITESDEASIVRLYYGIFNRAPDQSGMNYWSNKLTTKSMTLNTIAKSFMASSEFKNKYGTLTDQAFVKEMYPQVFGRQADTGGLSYWTNRLTSKKITREGLMVQFTQSSEMKNAFASRVALALNIDLRGITTAFKTFDKSEVTCNATLSTASNGVPMCNTTVDNRVGLDFNPTGVFSRGLVTIPVEAVTNSLQSPTTYGICFNYTANKITYGNTSTATFDIWALDRLPTTAGVQGYRNVSVNPVPYNSKDASVSQIKCTYFELRKNVKYVAILVASQGQSAGASLGISLNSVELRKTNYKTTVSGDEQQSGQIYTRNTGFVPAYIDGSTRGIYDLPREQRLKLSDARPHWVHKTDYVQGKFNIRLASTFLNTSESQQLSPRKINIQLKDAVTGVPINFTYYQSKFDPATGLESILKQSSAQQPFTRGYELSDTSAWIEGEVSKATKLQLEINWVEGAEVVNLSSDINWGPNSWRSTW